MGYDTNKLYDSEQKERFLNEVCSSSERAYNDFVSDLLIFSKFEYCFEKDVSCFSVHQLTAMLESGEVGKSTFDRKIRHLKMYFKWCGRTMPIIKYEQLEVFDSFKKKYLRDADDLMQALDEEFSSDDILILAYKVCIVLMFLGISKSDVVSIRLSDIDKEEKRIFIAGQNRYVNDYNEIPDCIFDMILRYMEATKDINGEYLIKDTRAAEVADKCDVLFVDKIFREYFDSDRLLTPTTIINSGFFVWLSKIEKADKEKDLSKRTYGKEFLRYMNTYYNNDSKKYYDRQDLYAMWKRTYSV